MGTKIYYQEGVNPSKDPRIPPQAANIKGLLILMGIALLVLGLGLFWVSRQPFAQRFMGGGGQRIVVTFTPNPITMTNIATTTLENTYSVNQLLATAFSIQTATPTAIPPTATDHADYCWFLTPSPTPTLTPLPLRLTPNGNDILQTATMIAVLQTPSPTPTPEMPRAWCNEWMALQTMRGESTDEPTTESTLEVMPSTPRGGFPTLPPFSPPPTWTPPPTAIVQQQPEVQVREVVITVEMIVTQPPQVITQQVQVQVPVIVTATFTPSYTPSATPTFTETPTETHTPTWTPTETATATPTETATSTQTSTETHIATFTPTWTHTPTWTPSATPTPTGTITEES